MNMLLKWLMFLLPFIYVFRLHLFGGNEQLYIVFSLLIFLSISGYILVFYVLSNKVPFPKYMVIYGLIIMYLAVSLVYMKYSFMIPSAISLLLTYVSLFFFVAYITYHNLFRVLYTYYSYGVVLVCVFLYLFSTFSLAGIDMVDNRFGWVSFNGEPIVDPNYFGVFIGLALFYFLDTWRQKTVSRRLIHLLTLLLLIYFFLATLSRGVVAVFVLVLILSFFIIHRKRTTILLALYGALIAIVVFFGVIDYYGSTQASSIQYTSFQRYFLMDTSNRLELWTAIVKGFFGSDLFTILFGNGFQSGSSIGAKYFYGWEPTMNNPIFINPHNMFLQFLVEVGIVGVFLMFVFFIIVCRHVWKTMHENHLIPLHLLLFFLGVNLSLNILGFRELFFCFMIFFFSSLTRDGDQREGCEHESKLNYGNYRKSTRSRTVHGVSS